MVFRGGRIRHSREFLHAVGCFIVPSRTQFLHAASRRLNSPVSEFSSRAVLTAAAAVDGVMIDLREKARRKASAVDAVVGDLLLLMLL